jgi:hypothetical protein
MLETNQEQWKLEKYQLARVIQYAELDIAKYLNRPEDFMVIEWLEGVQQQLADALHLLDSNPIPLLENDDEQ